MATFIFRPGTYPTPWALLRVVRAAEAWRQADEFCRSGESARVEIENPLKGASTTEPKTHTLDVPGAVLSYDVRSNDASTQPVLLLIGSPMGATGFGTWPDISRTVRW